MTKRLLAAVITVLLISACKPGVEHTSRGDAQKLVDSLVYVRSKHGVCFGVGTTSRTSSDLSFAEANVVDCNAVGLTSQQ